LVFLQGAQAAFSGATVCREASGKITLEWAGAQCESAEEESLPCGNKAIGVPVEQCQSCLDVPISSEQPLKSLALSFEPSCLLGSASVVFVLPEPAGSRFEPIAVPQYPAFEHLRSTRLLI